MSGGGVTPFSPTPWIFDTGDSPQTMGQNCVAGTTEHDEKEGIGLVLYVNSESNLIVWKMSDGTKQGTAVPLTTEYQSMLKSEFENKTGETIGYVIIHRYTEETIDIESSITINSGDTPVEQTIKIKMAASAETWVGGLAGENLRIYSHWGSAIGIKADGTFGNLSSVGVPTGLVDAVNNALGTSYTEYSLFVDDTLVSPIPDWENYKDCNP